MKHWAKVIHMNNSKTWFIWFGEGSRRVFLFLLHNFEQVFDY